jgi:hypothetical protein
MTQRYRTMIAWAAGALLAATPGVSNAQVDAGRERSGHLSGFFLVKANSKLARVPDRLVTARLDFEKAHFATIAATKVLKNSFTFLGRGNSLEAMGEFGKHFGNERTAEANAALVLRSGQLGIVGGTSLNVAWGNGLSYAFTRPRAESGESGIRGVGAKHFQYYMNFETELTDSSAPNVHVVLRLDHRSGVYGLISSQRTGSNYLGAGLRFDFK